MYHRSNHKITLALACVGCVAIATATAAAQELEVTCAEGAEPMPRDYGAHTGSCAISPATDSDGFSFIGFAGDHVRIVLMGNTNGFDPRLEPPEAAGDRPTLKDRRVAFEIEASLIAVEAPAAGAVPGANRAVDGAVPDLVAQAEEVVTRATVPGRRL